MARTETKVVTEEQMIESTSADSDVDSDMDMHFEDNMLEEELLPDESIVGGGLDKAKVAAKKKKAAAATAKKAKKAKKAPQVKRKAAVGVNKAPEGVISKKKRRYHPGTVSKRMVKKLQNSPGTNIAPRSPIERMVRAYIAEARPGVQVKISKQYIRVLHEIFENDMQCIMEAAADANAYKNNRKTLDADTLRFAIRRMNTGIDPVVFESNCPHFNADLEENISV